MSEQDEITSYYFFTLLLLMIIPLISYHFVKYRLFSKVNSSKKFSKCLCSHCITKPHRHPDSKYSLSFWLEFFVVFFLCYLLVMLVMGILDTPQYQVGFDPYEILGLSTFATESDAKKAFRQLSKIYHPDKNPGNDAHYININKAYKTLTDKTAWENYQAYGNPDGYQRFKFGFALPSFMMKTDNQVITLAVFFILIIVIIPGSLILWVKRSSDSDQAVAKENAFIYKDRLTNRMTLSDILLLISLTDELDGIKTIRAENEELLELREKYLKLLPRIKNLHPRNTKIILLLVAYLYRESISSSLKKDLNYILLKTDSIIDLVLSMGFGLNCTGKTSLLPSFFFNLIEFSQLLSQGLSPNANRISFITQFPIAILKELSNIPALQDQLHSLELPPSQLEDIKEVLKQLPSLQLSTTISPIKPGYAKGETLTINVAIEQLQLAEDTRSGPIHSLTTPHTKYEKFYLLIVSDEKVIFFLILPIAEKHSRDIFFEFTIGKDLKLPAGEVNWILHVCSSSYPDCNFSCPIAFTVIKGKTT